MSDVYQKYMHRIAIAITTRLQDRGEGLTMLSKEAVTNSIPQQACFFFLRKWQYPQAQPVIPQKQLALLDKLVISSTPSQAPVKYFYHQTESNVLS